MGNADRTQDFFKQPLMSLSCAWLPIIKCPCMIYQFVGKSVKLKSAFIDWPTIT